MCREPLDTWSGAAAVPNSSLTMTLSALLQSPWYLQRVAARMRFSSTQLLPRAEKWALGSCALSTTVCAGLQTAAQTTQAASPQPAVWGGPAGPRTQLQSSEKSTMPSLEDVGRGGVWLGSEKRCYQHHKWAKRAERQEMVLPPSKTEEAQERLPGRRGRSQQADHGQDAHFS